MLPKWLRSFIFLLRSGPQYVSFLFFSSFLRTATPPVPRTLVCVVLVFVRGSLSFPPESLSARKNDYPWCSLKASWIWKGLDRPWTRGQYRSCQCKVDFLIIFSPNSVISLCIASLVFSFTLFSFCRVCITFSKFLTAKLFDMKGIVMFFYSDSQWANGSKWVWPVELTKDVKTALSLTFMVEHFLSWILRAHLTSSFNYEAFLWIWFYSYHSNISGF